MIRETLAALVSCASMAVGPITVMILTAPAACIIPSISSKQADAGTPAAAADGGATAVVQGASCTQLTAAISLCKYISACPQLVLNSRVFPQCGFHIHGGAIDPECLCQNQYLCPIGVPTTCAEATTLASGDTTYDSVCAQALTGGCKDLSAPASATSGSGGGTKSIACQTCLNNCDNVPSCVDACGC